MITKQRDDISSTLLNKATSLSGYNRVLRKAGTSLMFFLLLLGVSAIAHAQDRSMPTAAGASSTNGLSKAEMVLQACFDNPILQKELPVSMQGGGKSVYLMQFPVVVPGDINLTVNGNKVVFIEKTAKPEVEAYFMVRSITQNSGKLTVNVNLFSKNRKGDFEMKNIFGHFQTAGKAGWAFRNMDIKKF
jgi:hypothetical protein